jgi:hypothetical protein
LTLVTIGQMLAPHSGTQQTPSGREVREMIRMKLLIGLLTISALMFGATPALAAAPPNDTIAGATVIAVLPFSDMVDTTEATTDADELAAGQPCLDIGAPAIEKAVWFKYTATADVSLLVNTTASSYSNGIASYIGAPSAAAFTGCAPGQLSVAVPAGQTAYLMVFGDTVGSPGGTLRISVQEAPPPPEISLTVDPSGTFDPATGSATVSGTATCTGIADFANLSGTVTQTVGRFTVSGFFFAPLACDGATHSWTATTMQGNGKFAGGPATVQVFAFACNVSGCGQASATQQLRLRR